MVAFSSCVFLVRALVKNCNEDVWLYQIKYLNKYKKQEKISNIFDLNKNLNRAHLFPEFQVFTRTFSIFAFESSRLPNRIRTYNQGCYRLIYVLIRILKY